MGGTARALRLSAVLLVATAVVGAGLALGAPWSTTATPTAQVLVSPIGNDDSCKRGEGSTPCRTWSQAYSIARSGDTIGIAGGSYAGETLTGTKTVTWRVADSQTATLTSPLSIRNLSNSTFWGPIVSSVPATSDRSMYMTGCSSNLEFHDLSGGTFDITESASNVRLYGGSWGGYTGRPWAGDSMIGGDQTMAVSCGNGIVRDVTLDGVRFHDVQYVPESGWGGGHPDCLESHGAFENLVIRNGIFERCGNTFFGTYLDWGSFRGLTIENNLMTGIYDSDAGIQIGNKPGWTCAGIVFRYNTYDPNNATTNTGTKAFSPPLINCPTDPTGQVYGNIFRASPRRSDCGDVVWSFNVFESGTVCGTRGKVVGDAFYVARGSDYHLRPGSPAIGAGDPARFPRTDVDGQKRPAGKMPDVGYDEAQGIVPDGTRQLLIDARDILGDAARAGAAAGNAACLGKTSASDRVKVAMDGLSGSLFLAGGKRAADPCAVLNAAVAGWNYLPAARFDGIAAGRRDRNFRSVAQLKPPRSASRLLLRGTTPRTRALAAAFNAETDNLARASMLLTAFSTSVARAEAAGNARDATAQDRQLAAARGFARQAATALSREPRLRAAVARALLGVGVPARGLTRTEAVAVAEIARRGLPSEVRSTLELLGLRRGEVNALARRVRGIRASDLVGTSVSGSLVEPSALTRLRATATAFRRLGAG